LQDALNCRHPRYVHLPLVLGPDGEKLSKRHGAPDLSALREGGADPLRVVAALALSAGLIPASQTRVKAGELVERFTMASVEGASARLPPHADFGVAPVPRSKPPV